MPLAACSSRFRERIKHARPGLGNRTFDLATDDPPCRTSPGKYNGFKRTGRQRELLWVREGGVLKPIALLSLEILRGALFLRHQVNEVGTQSIHLRIWPSVRDERTEKSTQILDSLLVFRAEAKHPL